MIPNTKISQTILEFGNPVIIQLPTDHTKYDFEEVIRIVVAAWNAVVIDSWDKSDKLEKQLLVAVETASKKATMDIKRLIKRKKKKYATDLRAVGNHWIREQNGEFFFGCEARLDLTKIQVNKDNTIKIT